MVKKEVWCYDVEIKFELENGIRPTPVCYFMKYRFGRFDRLGRFGGGHEEFQD